MPNPTELQVAAPAKINLTLHVTGQRGDGYHLLDSLVAFATVHDRLWVAPGDGEGRLIVTGPEAAGVPADGSNLVWKAHQLFDRPCDITLDKILPAAAGIGGGSADAAAMVRAMLALRGAEAPDGSRDLRDAVLAMRDQVVSLGADLPMCLTCDTVRARGIGDALTGVLLPDVPAVLVNPRVAVSTPDVFRRLASKTNPAMPDELPAMMTPGALIGFLTTQRNDLEAPARALVPAIGDVLAALSARPGCALARMSGSGATCFGLFATQAEADAADRALRDAHPGWWVAAGIVGSQAALALPHG